MPTDIPPYLYFIFIAATAIGVLIQAVVLLVLSFAFLKFASKLEAILKQVTEKALPLIESSQTTIEELTPRLKTISANLVEVSETLKHESRNIKGSVDDVLEKTRAQTARVDEMISGTLDGLSQANAAIRHGVEVPLRHLYGIMNGLRAGLETLWSKRSEPRIDPMTEVDEPEVIVVVEEVVIARPVL